MQTSIYGRGNCDLGALNGGFSFQVSNVNGGTKALVGDRYLCVWNTPYPNMKVALWISSPSLTFNGAVVAVTDENGNAAYSGTFDSAGDWNFSGGMDWAAMQVAGLNNPTPIGQSITVDSSTAVQPITQVGSNGGSSANGGIPPVVTTNVSATNTSNNQGSTAGTAAGSSVSNPLIGGFSLTEIGLGVAGIALLLFFMSGDNKPHRGRFNDS
jgi:hypothetical protein